MLPSHNIPADDSGLDRCIGLILRTGMLLSAAVVLLGGLLFLMQQGNGTVNFRTFHGEPPELTSVTIIARDAVHGNALQIIQLGLLLLIATPVARVIFSVAAFTWERDYLYVSISLIVLVVLLYSLFGPKTV
jgi:uncharacterized membrane protein